MFRKSFDLFGKLLIFQIWWNETDDIEEKYQQLIDKNEKILEAYPHYIFTRKDIKLFLKQNQELKEIFDKFSKEVNSYYFQSDLLRFMILYKYGGIYLDLDVELYDNFYEFYNELNTKYLNFEFIPDDKHIFF
jgi:mannosyltransferase OCH1-like enzyme